jgi:DnaJ-class molecular chaperone
VCAQPHATLAREGSNLIYNARIPLVDALTGFKLDVQTLDNRILRVNIKDTVHPKYTKVHCLSSN